MLYCHERTSEHSVIGDAIFGRIDDIGDMFKKEVHEEFVLNVLMKERANLFPEYSYMYVLVAHSTSNRAVSPGELTWTDVLNKSQNAFMETHRAYILGYMLMSAEHPTDVHFVEYIDTRLPGYNIADCMIKRYENEIVELSQNSIGCRQVKPQCVIPKEIRSTSAEYWKKYFVRRLGIRTNEDLIEMKNTLRIHDLITWYYLEQLF